MENPVSGDNSIKFSLVSGGPFHSILARLGLLGPDKLPNWRTVVVLVLLAWAPPAVLAISQSLLHADYAGWDFFTDSTVYTRYLVAVTAMVATERFADGRVSVLVNQFLQARLVAPDAVDEFRTIVVQADQRSAQPLAEAILLIVALAGSWWSFYFVSTVSVSGWEEWTIGGETHLSWAGTAAELVGNPLFMFLVLRWFWRFLVWAQLLARTSRLPLKLTAMHPDRVGGLIFLGLFPGIFIGFVFALSCVISSSLVKTIALLGPSQQFVWLAIAAWVLLVVLVFVAPLFFFSMPIYRLREQALIEYGRLAQVHHQLFHDRWITYGKKTEELLGSPDPSSSADLNGCIQAVLDMRFMPLDWASLVQLAIAALAPFVVVVASRIPLAEVLKWIVGAVL